MSEPKLEDRNKITSQEYNLPSFENFAKQMEAAVRKGIDDFIRGAVGERANTYLRAGAEFDPAKPMIVEIRVPLGLEDDPPIWRTDVEREIRDFMDDRYSTTHGFSELDRKNVEVMRNKLAELVAYYDEKLKEKDHA